jgi:hypothetical protein
VPHAIIEQHPRWQALQDRRREAAQLRDRAMEAATEHTVRVERARAEHAAARAAAERGEGDWPPPFEAEAAPDVVSAMHRATLEMEEVGRLERQHLRRHGHEVHAELRAREAALLDEVADAVDQLVRQHGDALDELDQLTRAGHVLAQANGVTGAPRSAQVRDVLDAVLDGRRILTDLPGADPEPAPELTEVDHRMLSDQRRKIAAAFAGDGRMRR